jgi:hypothetical protein
LSFWSHRSDAATRDRIELSFAAVLRNANSRVAKELFDHHAGDGEQFE